MFINATQSTTVRLDLNATSEEFTGLSTEHLATCLCLVVVSSDKTRFSLTHTATAADAHDIVRECYWAGEGSTLYIIKGAYYNTPQKVQFLYSQTTLFPRLRTLIAQENVAITWDDTTFDQPAWAVTVTRSGDIQLRTALSSVINAPEHNYRYLVHMINTHTVLQERLACVPVGMYFHPLDLLFDGADWAKKVTLSKQARTLLTALENDATVSSQIDWELKRYIGDYHKVLTDYDSKIETANVAGTDFYNAGDYEAASVQFEKSIRYLTLVYGEADLRLGSVYYNLGSACSKLHRYERALYCLNEAVRIRECYLNQKDILVKKAKKRRGEIKSLSKKYISVDKMQAIMRQVHARIVTSNDIIPRVECPYYFNNSVVPIDLSLFKAKLTRIRTVSSQELKKMTAFPVGNYPAKIWNFSDSDSFMHTFIGSLVSTEFGVGECSECCALSVVNLLRQGYGDFAFVGVRFPKAKHGMEQTHAFLVVNFPKMPMGKPNSGSIFDFFAFLPSDVLIVDPFNALCFSPSKVPDIFRQYLAVYGGLAVVDFCYHFYNLSDTFLRRYRPIVERVTQALRSERVADEQGHSEYDLSEKRPLEEQTTLIRLLNRYTSLTFWGLQDSTAQVDAVTDISTPVERRKAYTLRRELGYRGGLHKTSQGQTLFVFKGINITEADDNTAGIGVELQTYFKGR